MKLSELKNSWDKLAIHDPLWAILTEDDKKGRKWDEVKFFLTGEKEISDLLKDIEGLKYQLIKKRALDFGCGVGRLTQALAKYFDAVIGIDISPTMIQLARKYNRYKSRCTYYTNDISDLRIFPDRYFNFIYSNRVLQHMKYKYAKNYIKEFIRLLSSDGLLVFQLPSEPAATLKGLGISLFPERFLDVVRGGNGLMNLLFFFRKDLRTLEMHGEKREKMIRFINRCGGRVLNVQSDQSGGDGWISYKYYVKK